MTPVAPKTETEAVTRYRPFVLKAAKRFISGDVPPEDLIQEGLVAVAIAFRSWRQDGGANFLTWIHRPVYYAMVKLVREQKRMGGSSRGGLKGESKPPVIVVSLDALIRDKTDRELVLHDVLGSFEEPPDPFVRGKLPAMVSGLPKRQRQVLRLRFERGLSYTDVGARLKISRELARQVEQKALERLRGLLANGEDPS